MNRVDRQKTNTIVDNGSLQMVFVSNEGEGCVDIQLRKENAEVLQRQ